MSASLLEKIKKGIQQTFFEEVFPNEFIEDELIIRSSDGNPAAGFFVTLPEKETRREEEIHALQESLERVFAQLPAGTVAHFQGQYFYTTNGLRALEEIARGFITSKMRDHLSDRPVLSNRVVLYLVFNFTGSKRRNPASTAFANYTRTVKNPLKNVERHKALAKNYLQTFVTQMNAISGIKLKMMNDLDLAQEKMKYLNLEFDSQPFTYGNSIENRGHEVAVGDKMVRTVFLRKTGNNLYQTMPNDKGVTSCMPWTMGHFLAFPHLVNFSFMVCDSEKEMKSLELEQNARKALGSLQKQVDRMIIKDIEEFTEETRAVNKTLVYMNHNVMTWDSDPEKLSLNVSMIKTAYTRMNGSIGLGDAYNAANYFFSFAPGMALDMFSTLLMPMDEALLHFDFTTPTKNEGNGIILCSREHEPLLVDLWSDKMLVNKNRIVIGPSGSGKSFTMNAILAQEVDQGVELVILDVGGSYKNMFNLNQAKGKYYEYNASAPISFNPFLIPKDRHGFWNLTEDKIIFLLTFITLLWKDTKKGEELSKEEESVITRLLTAYYAQCNTEKNSKPRLEPFVAFVKKFADENKESSDLKYFDISSFTLVLEKFTQGSYAKAVNSDDNENIATHRLVIFDLAGIQNDPILYPIVALIIIELVLDKIRANPTIRKEIVIDEAWTMLQGALAKFIENLYRTIRKSNGAVTIVSQSIIELMNSPVGLAIKANAATRILLDHNSQPSLIPPLQEFFGMTDHAIEQLKSLRNHGASREIFLSRGSVDQVFLVDGGPHAGAAFSSWSQDRDEIQKLAKIAGPEYAVNQYVENRKIGTA